MKNILVTLRACGRPASSITAKTIHIDHLAECPYQGDGTEHVQIGYNPKTKAVAFRGVTEGDKGCYRLRAQANGLSRLVDGKRFFAHHGLSFDAARSFAAEDFGDGLVGFTLSEKN